MHQSSLDKMTAFRDRHLSELRQAPIRILDIGSQDINGSYRLLFDQTPWRYAGVDVTPGRNVDIVLRSQYSWREIPSASIDVVVSGQALEHVEYFWITMLEVARVLKPGGFCCVIAPSSGPEHRYPVDCWRFYPDGLRALARFARLEPLEASTQWQDLGYADGCDMWHDSMLVCRKPVLGPWKSLKATVTRRLRHWASMPGNG